MADFLYDVLNALSFTILDSKLWLESIFVHKFLDISD